MGASMGVSLLTDGVQVTPGARAAFSVEVVNLGSVVDRYTCEIVGVPADWVTVTPASLELFPQQGPADGRGRPTTPPSSGQFSVNIHPPRVPEATAGPRPIGAKVTSEDDPASHRVEEGTIVFLPFGALEARLRPAVGTGRFGASGVLEVVNRGNRTETVTLAGSDPAERVRFEVEAESATIEAGATKHIPFRLSAGAPKLLGGRETLPFTIALRAATDTPSISMAGVFDQRALIPSGLPIAAATILALAMGALALTTMTRPGPDLADHSATQSPTANPSPKDVAGNAAAPATAPPASAAPATPGKLALLAILPVGPTELVAHAEPPAYAKAQPRSHIRRKTHPGPWLDPCPAIGRTGLWEPQPSGQDHRPDQRLRWRVRVEIWWAKPPSTEFIKSPYPVFPHGDTWSTLIDSYLNHVSEPGTLSFYLLAFDTKGASAKSEPASVVVLPCP